MGQSLFLYSSTRATVACNLPHPFGLNFVVYDHWWKKNRKRDIWIAVPWEKTSLQCHFWNHTPRAWGSSMHLASIVAWRSQPAWDEWNISPLYPQQLSGSKASIEVKKYLRGIDLKRMWFLVFSCSSYFHSIQQIFMATSCLTRCFANSEWRCTKGILKERLIRHGN